MQTLYILVVVILWICYFKLFPRKPKSIASLPCPPKHPIFGHIPAILDSDNLVYYLEHWACELGELYQLDLPFSTAVVVASPTEVMKILKQRPNQFRKPKAFQSTFFELGLRGLLTVDGDEWKHSRKLISPAFTTSKLKSMSNTIIKYALEFRQELLEMSKKQQLLASLPCKPSLLDDCSSLFAKFTFSIILEVAFGTIGDLMTPEFSEKGKIALQVINERLDRVFPVHKIYATSRDIILDEFLKELDGFTDKLIVEYRRGDKRFEGTLFENLMVAHDESNDIDYTLLKGNLKVVLLAGSETTSNSIQSMLRLFVENPDVLRKVQVEVDSVLGENLDFYNHTVDEFPYCQNVVKEVLRIYSVLNFVSYECSQPAEVGGNYYQFTLGISFPQGTEFFLLLRSAIFRDNYPTPNPLVFNPDRWSGLDEKTYKLQTSLSMGFGGGPRICPGKNLANVEMVYALAYAISAFDVKLFPRLPSSPSPVEVASTASWHNNFYPMFLKRKEAAE